eukprot:3968221-Amphidinium_carterae.1
MLEPYGSSVFDTLSLKEVWKGASSGNKKAKYHSHLCADQATDAWHIGAGISQTAAALLAAITHLKTDNMKKLLDKDVYAKVMAEVSVLEPHLLQLNLGKGPQTERDTGSFRAVKKRKTASAPEVQTSTEATVLNAAGELHKWLSQEASPLRSTLFLLAACGMNFISMTLSDVYACMFEATTASSPLTLLKSSHVQEFTRSRSISSSSRKPCALDIGRRTKTQAQAQVPQPEPEQQGCLTKLNAWYRGGGAFSLIRKRWSLFLAGAASTYMGCRTDGQRKTERVEE